MRGERFNRGAIAAALVLSMAYPSAGEAPGEPPTRARWDLSFKGFGPVTVGMSVREAEKALKVSLNEDDASESCHYARNDGDLPGVAFMVVDGKIARVDISSPAYRTSKGARVGMTEQEVRQIYPKVAVEPHPYDDAGHHLVVTSDDERHGMVFETNGKVVTEFRAGWREPVGYIEGCL